MQDQFLTILEGITDGLAACDRQGCITYINQRGAEIVGRSQEQLIGTILWESFPWAIASSWKREFQRAIAQRVSVEIEQFYPNLNRGIKVKAIPSETGLVIYYQDITDSPKLRTSHDGEERGAQGGERGGSGVAIASATTDRLEQVNSTWVKILGYEVEELIGTSIFDLFSRECHDQLINTIRLADAGGFHRFDSLQFGKEGRQIRGITEVNSIKDAEGTLLYRVLTLTETDAEYRPSERVVGKRIEITELDQAIEMLESMTDAFIALDREWRIIEITGKTDRINQKLPGELIGKTHWEVWPWSLGTEVEREYRRAMQEQVAVHLEVLYEPLKIQLEIRAYPSNQGLFIYLRDISDRKQSEEALKHSERLYEAIGETLKYGIWICDREGRMIYVSESFQELIGLTVAECAGWGWTQALHPEDREQTLSLWETCVRTENIWDREHQVRGVDGNWYPVLCRGVPVKNDQGETICWAGITLDISRQKQVERELRDRQERLQAALAASETGTYRWNIQTDSVEWDETMNRLFGLSEGYVLTTLQEFVSLIHPEDREALKSEVEKCGQASEDFEMEFRILYPDGSIRWIFDKGKTFTDEGGTPLYLTGACVDITNQKRMEEAVQIGRERLDLVLDSSELGLWYCDLPFDKLVWNQKCKEHFGLPPETEVTIAIFFECLHPEDRDRTQEAISRAIAEATPYQIDYRTVEPTGKIRWIRAMGRAFYTETGQPIRFDGITVDISDRKRAEETLESNQKWLTLAQNIGTIGICDWDLESRKIIFSEEMHAIYGLLPVNFDGTLQTLLEQIHPSDRARVEHQARCCTQDGVDFNSEFRIQWPDGQIRWIVAKARAFQDERGKPVRVIGVNMDVTDRKLAEEALRESEQRFRVAQELSLDAFTILQAIRNSTGEIIDFQWDYANPKAAELLGYSLDELVGHRLSNRLPGNKTNSELFHRYVQVVETGIPHDIELEYKADGIRGWFRNMAVKLEDGVAISFSNITDRKLQEQERLHLLEMEREARSQAEVANRIKDEFLAILSHELRSPLNPILGWTQLLKKGTLSPDKTLQALNSIERNAKLQTELIEDLLDVSRILRGKLILTEKPVKLAEVIDSAIETVRLAAQAKFIQVYTEFNPEVGQVLGDSNRLQQAVWNLLSNAVKFTPAGGRVTVYLTQVADYVQIQVQDTGAGIDPDFLPHVFESFRQADSTTTRTFGGLGLGLAIARHLVELHGGRIWADSPGPGQGATFTVNLPLLPESREPSPPESSAPELPNLQGIKILVVDDILDTREFLVFLLEMEGARVQAVESAEMAISMIRDWQPDILISDIGMPELDGYGLIRTLRSRSPQEGGTLPAIAVTAYAGESDRQAILSAGFDAHIPKPVEPLELAQAIARLLPRSVQVE
ncbi:PAS domain-containing protein [Laspinema olomoucense]|uniref:PAS domain-containing protein n=1 Tax=Laspinema olomoucense TaxID=3231600 RepID=UPI0021BB2377|nr:PAS domain-containing protein [Laspinema sp. D3a]MCT7991754.1 PAS domain-containing protein [Laspinema sp. D3a]